MKFTKILASTMVGVLAAAVSATAASAATAASTTTTAAPAALPVQGTEFVSTVTSLPTIVQGSSTWITSTWLGHNEVTDFQVSAKSNDGSLSFAYPNAQTYSSLSVDSTLSPAELDYNAVKVNVPSTATAGVKAVTVTVNYKVSGVARSWSVVIPVTVVAYSGGTFTPVTKTVTVPAGSAGTWVNLSFLGVAPTTENFRLKVTDAKGAIITYPADGTATGLNGDTSLSAGETDLVAFKAGSGALKAGTYALTWGVTYGANNDKTATGTFNLVVS